LPTTRPEADTADLQFLSISLRSELIHCTRHPYVLWFQAKKEAQRRKDVLRSRQLPASGPSTW
jgi:hypothetical protein